MRKIQMSQISPMNIHYALYPLEYFLDSLVKYDIQAVELWGGSPHVPIEDATFASVCRIRDEIVRRDLNIACFTPEYQGYLGLEIYNSTYYLDPDQALEQALNHIRAAIG